MGQVFFYHPSLGAQTIDTTGLRMVDCTIQPVPKKDVDNVPSLVQNTRMCKQARFVTAVLMTVGELRQSPFSAYNITKRLREQVNAGDLAITDKTPEDVDGVTSFRIDHNEVKDVFQELLHHNVVTGLTSRDAGQYIEYSDSQPTATAPQQKQTARQLLGIATCVGVPVQATTPNDPLKQKTKDYLIGRRGQAVTMKEVQSRFKGVNKTCKEWADLISGIGLVVNSYGTSTPSTWVVQV